MVDVNDRIRGAIDILLEVGEELETALPSNYNYINNNLSDILEDLNNLESNDIDKILNQNG
jgi:ABC-type Zn uptake system ZnuABC Zn-binding protein ZnuA